MPSPIIDKVLIHEKAVNLTKLYHLSNFEFAEYLDKVNQKVNNFILQQEKNTGKNVTQLFAGSRIYKLRLDAGNRAIFSIEGHNKLTLKWLQFGNHELGEEAHHKKDKLLSLSQSTDIIELSSYQVEQEIKDVKKHQRYYCWSSDLDSMWLKSHSHAQLRWNLDIEQEMMMMQDGPVILRGSAGSGKTTIALYRLMHNFISYSIEPSDSIGSLYITYSERLKNDSQKNFLLLKRQEQHVKFLTIDELCLQWIDNESKLIFNRDYYVGFYQFEDFVKKRKGKRFSAYLLWEEFRGILKGCYHLAINTEQEGLTFEQYKDLCIIDGMAQDDSLFSLEDRPEVFKLFKNYQKWLKDNKKWDDLDLARQALIDIKGKNLPNYEQIIVDEIQDLTTYHIQLILQLCQNPKTLFLTGDANQSIHPSRFNWSRLKAQTYFCFQSKAEVQHITKNYRCSSAIIELINELSVWRKVFFKENSYHLESINDNEQPIVFIDTAKNSLQPSGKLSVNIMILVANEQEKVRLVQEGEIFHHCSDRVFTIHESKGLEYDTVILYQFFTIYKDFNELINKKMKETTTMQHRLHYLVNLFNVACTRSREELIVIDRILPLNWKPIKVIRNQHDDIAINMLSDVFSRTSTNEDYIEEAMDLEANKNWWNAAETWKKIYDYKNYYRCLAILEEQKSAWEQAAKYYRKAEILDKAYQCYEKIENYTEMFIILLEMPLTENVNQELEQFFDDPKKMAKLPKNMWSSLLEKIVESHSEVAASILFRYATERCRLQRENIRRLERDIEHKMSTSQEARQRFQQCQQILQNFNQLALEI